MSAPSNKEVSWIDKGMGQVRREQNLLEFSQ